MQTAQQHGITPTGVLQPCGSCLEAKGTRSGTPRRTTSRTGRPMETVLIDWSTRYEASVGESVYLIMFVERASRWMRPYGMRRKFENTALVQKFLADMNGMGRPNCSRTDNGGEFISADYVEYLDSAGIRREYTAPRNVVVESAIWRAIEGGHAARLEIGRLFPDVDLGKIPFVGATGNRLWIEAAPLGFQLSQPLPDQGEHRMAVTARGFLRATAGPAGGSFSPSRNDAGGPEHQVRCPYGQVFLPQQRPQPLLAYRQGSQKLHRKRVLFQRHCMDGALRARPVIATAGGGGGFSGLSVRCRADITYMPPSQPSLPPPSQPST